MAPAILRIYRKPRFAESTLIMGMSGWMNGGEVSTGSLQFLIDAFKAKDLAEIDSEGFYIYGIPGPMEMTAMFRPHSLIQNGLVTEYSPPTNTFLYDRKNRLIFFIGREPHINWEQYADCIFSVCDRFNVSRIYLAGSVGGLTPHTREPTILCMASNPETRDSLMRIGLKPVDYEGPASFSTLLTARIAHEKNLNMISLIAEIPAYVEGYNPRGIETMTRCIARLCGLRLDMGTMKATSVEFERKLTDIVKNQPELFEKIKELETEFDRNAFNREMGDLKKWLSQQGIRVE
jgi:predicted ATP-grasp superfamily ATP-dependent carboligase